MAEPTVFLNGLFMPLSSASVSVLDRGFNYGDGLFETMRSYGGKIFRLDAHLDRLYQSLETIYLLVPMTVGEMKSAVRETLIRNGHSDSMIRLTISRGEQNAGFHIDPETAPTLVIIVRPLETLPREWVEKGIKISLFPSTAQKLGGLGRQIKSCNFPPPPRQSRNAIENCPAASDLRKRSSLRMIAWPDRLSTKPPRRWPPPW